MPNGKIENRIGIIGGGPVGSLLSIFLAQKGISSRIYERRPDLRLDPQTAGKSINLALSVRGLHALRQVGLADEVLRRTIPMKGRMVHSLTQPTVFHPYSQKPDECIYSISRSELNALLLTAAEETGRVETVFGAKVSQIDFKSNCLTLEKNAELTAEAFTRLIAADGAHSVARNALVAAVPNALSESTLDYGYKEITLPPSKEGTHRLDKNSLHIWPRGNFMLIALPDIGGSFTCTLFLPHLTRADGLTPSFADLNSEAEVDAFFKVHFPDFFDLMPEVAKQYFARPIGHMVTVKCSPWHVSDQLLLIGDSAHAIVPFFGQGMNCGFEDCTVLSELLPPQGGNSETNTLNWSEIFSKVTELRKVNADRIADMALENFIEMRDKVSQKQFQLEKGVQSILQVKFPKNYASRYSLVTFSRTPYHLAYEAGMIEDRILKELCRDISTPDQVDLKEAEILIQSELTPFFERNSKWILN